MVKAQVCAVHPSEAIVQFKCPMRASRPLPVPADLGGAVSLVDSLRIGCGLDVLRDHMGVLAITHSCPKPGGSAPLIPTSRAFAGDQLPVGWQLTQAALAHV